MSWFVTWEIFLALNLWLATRALLAKTSLVAWQTFIVYSTYAVMISLDLSVLLFRHSWGWSDRDTLTAKLVLVGVLVTLLAGNFDFKNPLMKGGLAIFFKAVPQFLLAWSIYADGGSGLSLAAIITGHVTILCRIGQLYMGIREAGWDKNRIGSFISEVPNELSWIAVTIVWTL